MVGVLVGVGCGIEVGVCVGIGVDDTVGDTDGVKSVWGTKRVAVGEGMGDSVGVGLVFLSNAPLCTYTSACWA